ncbi:MAG: HlyD family type I secretion periplasmic adaptor subunit [Gammaproteobacteria bacterium]|nr:HlyD family type I secretion periplasmic adaptor subunit [Gammaproteobacteria bacterium]
MRQKNPLQSHELDFLPAALEIQERPPSPLGRAIVWSLVAFFLIALIWSIVGHIDIVATAQGKIIPSGHVKVIQPLEIGNVRAIHVAEGQHVEQGDVLIELDPTLSAADRDRLNSEYQTAHLNRARLAALAKQLQTQDNAAPTAAGRAEYPMIDPDQVSSADAAALTLQQQLLRTQWTEFTARIAALDADLAKRAAELAGVKAQVTKLQQTLPLVTQRADALKGLVGKKLVPENQWLELEQERIEQQQDLESDKQRSLELNAAITEARQQRNSVQAEFAGKVYTDLAEAERQQAGLEQELIKATQRTGLQTLTAPIAGIVQQLAVHTVGGVVTPAQELLKIVPQQGNLEIEAWVLNKDIGFVTEGQRAEIKVETFPFTQYGTLDAEVIDVSSDAVTDEEKGLIYAARVLMKTSTIRVNDKLVNLTPGMAVTVEVKTGTRRLIEFVLSPLLKYRDEGLRER